MNLTQDQWWAQAQSDGKNVILDVRTDEECRKGMIPNAIHVDLYKGQGFIHAVEEMDKEKRYFVYCHAGGRSSQACMIMNQLGFDKTFNLLGGISEWEGPVIQP